jgi:hypothetical protein
MQSLAPIEPRQTVPDRPAATKLTWGMATIAVGAAACVALFLDWHDVADSLRRHALVQAEIAICLGALPGFLLSRSRPRRPWRRSTIVDRLHAVATPVPRPPAPGYTHYLTCTLLAHDADDTGEVISESISRTGGGRTRVSPGMLFLGPAGITFQPAVTEAGREAARASEWDPPSVAFEIGPVRMVRAVPVALATGRLPRMGFQLPPHAMLVCWPAGRALFAVPAIGDTLPRLHDCLDTLRWGTSLAGGAPLRVAASAVINPDLFHAAEVVWPIR